MNRDIETLITAARNDFANNPLDISVQQRLKALLDLQSILQRQELTQDQLKLVRDQVSALAPASQSVVPISQPVPPSMPVVSAPSVPTPPAQPISQPLQQLLTPGTLAGLIKATAARQQQPTPPPQIPTGLLQVVTSTPTPAQPAAVTSAENPLIAALKARGLLPSTPAPASNTASSPSLTAAFPFVFPGQMHQAPPVSTMHVSSNKTDSAAVVQISTASIKMSVTFFFLSFISLLLSVLLIHELC